jgi:hypothetical protein
MFGVITHVKGAYSVSVYPSTYNFNEVVTAVAIKWIHDNAGINNYKETLSSDWNVEQLPSGYVLKYAPGVNATVSTVANAQLVYINLYYNTEIDNSGWIFSARKMNSEHIGFFGYVPIGTNVPVDEMRTTLEVAERRLRNATDELDRALGVIDHPVSERRSRLVSGKNDVQDETIKLIKNFDFTTLRPIAGTFRVIESDDMIIGTSDSTCSDSSAETDSDYSDSD